MGFECTLVALNLGIRSKGLISKATLDEGLVELPPAAASKQYAYCHYTYEYDAKGYISKITMKEKETFSSNTDSSTTVYAITYVDSD